MGRRSRGDGSVYFDADRGCWVGQVDLGRDPQTGRRRRPKVYAPTKTECREKLDELREEKRRTGTVARRDVIVAQLVQDLLDSPPAEWRAPSTFKVYRSLGNHITTAVGQVRVARLTVSQVEGMLRAMAAGGAARRTIARTRSLLARAIRRAERDGRVSRNVAMIAEMPAAPARKSRALTLEQTGKLLGLDLTAWWRAFILTGVTLGLRPGELLGLRWENVDLDGRILRVRGELKTEQSRRTLRIPVITRNALAALWREQAADRLRLGEHYADGGVVFCGNAGRPPWPQDVAAAFKGLCERAGLGRDWQLRELRHTFVSQMSQAGVDLEVIADHVGHVNSNITREVYRHQLADEIGAAAMVFDRLYGASS